MIIDYWFYYFVTTYKLINDFFQGIIDYLRLNNYDSQKIDSYITLLHNNNLKIIFILL